MAKKRKEIKEPQPQITADITYQPITETIEKNYMPYVMSVIISRAIPEIDGFKPSHRKLLYTMFKMGLLTGPRTKSANVVGQTMRLNPHGDAAIYETMVRLTRGNESLLHPFVDSKGSFGKQYSSSMAYAASRYTEVKLDTFCSEIFRGIDHDAVDFIPNYDNTMNEPVLLPTAFPNILVSCNKGVAVGIASDICSFNLAEVCDGTIQLLKNPDTSVDRILDIIKAPDFPGGASLIYDRDELKTIYETGYGKVRLRARYRYDPDANCIEILQIPYSTTIEAITAVLTKMVQQKTLNEITDLRDEIDLNGFKLTLDLRKGVDADKLMQKLFAKTPLENSVPCNFNVLIRNTPKQLGVIGILKEWIDFRLNCVRRELTYDCDRKKEKLHLLLGLGKILLDLDKAIAIIRETEKEADVVPNLMAGFSIDEIQANYIADIKLRNINREYILNRVSEMDSLRAEIAHLEELVHNPLKTRAYIAEQLAEIKKKYGKPRKTQLIYEKELPQYVEEKVVENYPVRLVLTKEGYFKKIVLPIRGKDEQQLKDGDTILVTEDAENICEVLFFTTDAQIYRVKLADMDSCKPGDLGDYIANKLSFDEGEKVIFMKAISGYNPNHHLLYFFANGKGVSVPMSAYETKTARKKLTKAFSSNSPVVGIFYEAEAPFDILLTADNGKGILISSTLVPQTTTRTAQGNTLFALKKDTHVQYAYADYENRFSNAGKCRKHKVPATGVLLEPMNTNEG